MSREGRSAFSARSLILPALVVAMLLIMAGCEHLLFPQQSPTTPRPTVGNSLELRDDDRNIDLRIRVNRIKLGAEPGVPPQPGFSRWLGVHLIIKNASSTTYRDLSFHSCASLVTNMKPSLDKSFWSTWDSNYPLPHTLPQSVTIKPGAMLDGWLWFMVQAKGKKGSQATPDFRRVHVFRFCPAGNSSSAVGTWQLKP